ncbi:MAG: tRNA lysidine(34) synthetase TilS [Lachnospiraceae bacterium]|nr:tRNA lysidine(34) synthetase TilS [Lachnospiraceae bacterium]
MISPKDTVIAGVSGGADSVCLLTLLSELSRDAAAGLRGGVPFTLEAVHVHHGIRKDTADRDAEFVRDLCKKLDVPFRIFYEDIPAVSKELGQTEEEAGRNRRYADFREAFAGRKGVIAVAHNADDQAETVLFNLMRGSSLKGLSGMSPVSGDIIRPLLFFTREEIENFLSERNIPFCTDETNLTDEHTRNRIRHHILSYMKKEISPKAVENICRAADTIRETGEYLEKKAEELGTITTRDDGALCLTIPEAEPLLLRKLIYRAITQAAGCRKDIGSVHVEAVLDLAKKKEGGFADLPCGIRARVRDGTVTFFKKEEKTEPDGNVKIPEGAITQRILTEFDTDKIPRSLYTKWFDYDKIVNALCVRTRQPGDYLFIDDRGNGKSLKKYLIDEKIPKEERDALLLVADGNHILWVIGHRISAYYKVGETTKRVLEIKADKEMLYGGTD